VTGEPALFQIRLDLGRSVERRYDQLLLGAEMVDEGVDAHAERLRHRAQ
jgi:hypothetical protein